MALLAASPPPSFPSPWPCWLHPPPPLFPLPMALLGGNREIQTSESSHSTGGFGQWDALFFHRFSAGSISWAFQGPNGAMRMDRVGSNHQFGAPSRCHSLAPPPPPHVGLVAASGSAGALAKAKDVNRERVLHGRLLACLPPDQCPATVR